ncbi:MAG TPA: hypothetical protein VHC41_04455 [Mycobacteriales bacterium]|jgi:hypothetical protein|nr:hypothetical protein [Mycobacteriales bacterium]
MPTRTGLVLHPRGAPNGDASVIVPLSETAQLRWRALRRLAVLAAVAAVACAALSALALFLLLPAVAAAGVAGYAGSLARAAAVRPRLHGGELVIPAAHPDFAAAVEAMPAGRCGGGGCETCVSACLPQASAV